MISFAIGRSGAKVYPKDPNSAWQRVYPSADAYFDGLDDHTMNSDARAFYHYHASGPRCPLRAEV